MIYLCMKEIRIHIIGKPKKRIDNTVACLTASSD